MESNISSDMRSRIPKELARKEIGLAKKGTEFVMEKVKVLSSDENIQFRDEMKEEIMEEKEKRIEKINKRIKLFE
ncbi:hypothetical protein EON65_52860 [archaeon]|nr:MAG: hypothetical protein EON65_52860 [archaeon]